MESQLISLQNEKHELLKELEDETSQHERVYKVLAFLRQFSCQFIEPSFFLDQRIHIYGSHPTSR